MKKYIYILMAALTLSVGVTSCETMKQIGGAIGLENRVRVPARVIACNSPTSTYYSGAGTFGGGSARTRVRASGYIHSQKITVQRLDNNTVMSGSISLDSPLDRVYRGNSGFVLIGVVSGEIRGFEKTAD